MLRLTNYLRAFTFSEVRSVPTSELIGHLHQRIVKLLTTKPRPIMPHYLIKEKGYFPILVYDAPVDDKTKELRKQFDVDEETGYPRHYNWRNMAKLGPVYNPEDPFYKFGEYKKESGYSTKVAIVSITAFLSGLAQYVGTYYLGRPLYSKPQYPLAIFAAATFALNFAHDKTLERASRKNMVYIDYMRKHPERFEPIHRPKLREVLWHAVPIR